MEDKQTIIVDGVVVHKIDPSKPHFIYEKNVVVYVNADGRRTQMWPPPVRAPTETED